MELIVNAIVRHPITVCSSVKLVMVLAQFLIIFSTQVIAETQADRLFSGSGKGFTTIYNSSMVANINRTPRTHAYALFAAINLVSIKRGQPFCAKSPVTSGNITSVFILSPPVGTCLPLPLCSFANEAGGHQTR